MMEKIIDTPGFNAVIKGRYGYVVFNKNDKYIGKAIEKYGEFSEFEVELFRQICYEGAVVVEVGANIGIHTLAIAGMVGKTGRVFAYEPQRIVFQTLCANMAINSIENVECYQIAVSSEDGFVLVPDLDYDVEENFGGVRIAGFSHGSKVPTARLDDLLDIQQLNFLKIDVEGMEGQVIRGASTLIETLRPCLYVENDVIEQSKELIELIGSFGYRMFWHLPAYFNINNYAGDRENIYPGLGSINMFCVHASVSASITGFQEITDSDFHPLQQ